MSSKRADLDRDDRHDSSEPTKKDRVIEKKQKLKQKKEEQERADLMRIRKDYFRQKLAMRNKTISRSRSASPSCDDEYASSRGEGSKVRESTKDIVIRRKRAQRMKREEQEKSMLDKARKSYFLLRKRLHDLKYVPRSLVFAWTKKNAKASRRGAPLSKANLEKREKEDSNRTKSTVPLSRHTSEAATKVKDKGSTKDASEDSGSEICDEDSKMQSSTSLETSKGTKDKDDEDTRDSDGKVSDEDDTEDDMGYITASKSASSTNEKRPASFKMSKLKAKLRAKSKRIATATHEDAVPSASAGGDDDGEDDDDTNVSESSKRREMLAQKWFEVSCLLRHDFGSSADYDGAVRRVREALDFIDSTVSIARRIDVNAGQLFQELLRRIGQTQDFARVGRDEGTYDAYAGDIASLSKIQSEEWRDLLDGARMVLDFVRIKLEDANDLETARSALRHSDTFFRDIEKYATESSIDPYIAVESL